MGTIIERKSATGTKYKAQVIKKKGGKVALSKSKTFNRKSAAEAWAKRIGREFDEGRVVPSKTATTVASLVDLVSSKQRDVGKTKAQVLTTIKSFAIAEHEVTSLTSADLVEFATQVAEGMHGPQARSPATTANYLSHLTSCLCLAEPGFDIPFDDTIVRKARRSAAILGLIGKSRKRTRRPNLAELDELMSYFTLRTARDNRANPMQKIVPFAIFSGRRQAEITRIQWEDYCPTQGTIKVRDMKDPGEKVGNDVVCELTPEAISIIESMPRLEERIFPYHKDVIGRQFTGTCQFLEIRNLRFHDLRHETASWLVESGRTLPQAMSVTGHKNWTSLQRYAHLKAVGNKFEEWKWLKMVT